MPKPPPPRVPDAITVASLDTHRLILTVDNRSHAEMSSNLDRAAVVDALRLIADQIEAQR